jgi:hypothetical protein
MPAKFKSIGLVVRNDMQSRQDSIRQVVEVLARHAEVLVHCLDFDQPLIEISSVSLEADRDFKRLAGAAGRRCRPGHFPRRRRYAVNRGARAGRQKYAAARH